MISEAEMRRIACGIRAERDAILRHNDLGSPDDTLLWMLLGCLISYLSLNDDEMPCFPGAADAELYRDAIRFVLAPRKAEAFDENFYIDLVIDDK